MIRRYERPLVCVILWIALSAAEGASAFPYETLQPETLARDAASLKHTNQGQLKYRVFVLDGEITTEGTQSTIDSHLLVNEARFAQQFVLSPNLALRLAAPTYFLYQKDEAKDGPTITSDAKWVEAQPRLDLVYSTQNLLDIALGSDAYYVRNYDYVSKTAEFTAKDSYHSAFYARPHLAIVKHGSNFDAGFTYQLKVEKNRAVTKSESIDNTSFTLNDKLFEPTTVAIFMRRDLAGGSIYGEFAAVEASGGGNKSSTGATSEEDYFRVQLSGAIPLASKSLVFEPALIYKSLSYADNRNVTLSTIPNFGLHLDLNFDNGGLPLFAGIILMRGTDGQSITEFNAKYKLTGYGATVGLNWGF